MVSKAMRANFSQVSTFGSELKTAQSFFATDKDIEFVRHSEEQRVTSVDALIYESQSARKVHQLPTPAL